MEQGKIVGDYLSRSDEQQKALQGAHRRSRREGLVVAVDGRRRVEALPGTLGSRRGREARRCEVRDARRRHQDAASAARRPRRQAQTAPRPPRLRAAEVVSHCGRLAEVGPERRRHEAGGHSLEAARRSRVPPAQRWPTVALLRRHGGSGGWSSRTPSEIVGAGPSCAAGSMRRQRRQPEDALDERGILRLLRDAL